MKLSIIIPVFNEAAILRTFWRRLGSAPIDLCHGIREVELIVVDDGSTDGSKRLLEKFSSRPFRFECGVNASVRYISEDVNRGKGYAVRKGIDQSTGDIVLIQDSDLEYSPADYPRLLAPITNDEADVVYGSRFSGATRRVLYFWHSVFNRILTTFSNALNNLNLSDIGTCYKAVRGNLARSLRLRSNRFGIEPEITARLARSKARIFEVPVSYRGRTYEEGKKIGKLDGIAAYFHTLWFGLLDTEPFKPGLYQTLTALDKVSSVLYEPLLRRGLERFEAQKGDLDILEIGSGLGSMTRYLTGYGRVTATDISADYVRSLKERFSSRDNVSVYAWDASKPPRPEFEKYDVIVCFNVLEHIEDDKEALKNWQRLLKPGGALIILVPAIPALFSPIDKALGHFRRYSAAGLTGKLEAEGLRVAKRFYGNALGIVGWIVTGLVMRKSELPVKQLRLYTVVKKTFFWAERIIESFIGLSIIVVAERENITADASPLTDTRQAS